MNMKFKPTLTILLGALACASACKSHVGDIDQAAYPMKDGIALFDSFDYIGNDDYYKQNPLIDEHSYFNPILPGWYSDPSICTNGSGDYFLATSTFTYYPGVPLFHSRDLINWKQVGHILNRESQLVNMRGQHVSGGIFAPAISYCKANKTYYMITTNVGAGNFFVKTTNPFGEWSDPIMVPEVTGIDPAFFFDEDGRGYIVNNDDAPNAKPEYPGHRTVRLVEFDINTDKCIGERKIIVNKGCRPEEKPIWCEGPHIYKINGYYYLMTAEGGTADWHSEVIYRSNSVFGPYTPWDGNPILTQRTLDRNRTNPITCAGHADLVQAAEGDWWAVFLACRPIQNKFENLGRETFMLPVRWTEDGWPYITEKNEIIPMQGSRKAATRNDSTNFGNFSCHYDFSAPVLPLEWMTLRQSGKSLYSLTENPGYLALKCAPISSSQKLCPAFVCRRIQHHIFESKTRLSFIPREKSEAAGLLIFKDETHQYFLAKTLSENGIEIALIKIGDNAQETLYHQSLPQNNKVTDLKVSSDGLSYIFSYSTNGKDWNTLGNSVDAFYTSTANAGGFCGTTIGLYATSINK
jgi:alpha-N-arabinofuranosidase